MKIDTLILIFILSAITSPFTTAKVIDGAWNGRPFDPVKLAEGVAKQDPDALAEWTYCSLMTECGIPFQEELIMQRASVAAKAGSALAKFVLTQALHYKDSSDTVKIKAHLDEALKAKHPLATWRLGTYIGRGDHGYEKNLEKGTLLLKEVAGLDATLVLDRLGYAYLKGDSGEIDTEEAAKLYQKALSRNDIGTAYGVINAKTRKAPYHVLDSAFSADDFKKARNILLTKAKLGQPLACYFYGGILLDEGKINEALPLLINSANRMPSTHYTFLQSYSRAMPKRFPKAYSTDILTQERQAVLAYEAGIRSENVRRWTANAYLRDFAVEHPKEKDGIAILVEIIKDSPRSNCNASHDLAEFLTFSYFKRPATKQSWAQYERGLAHFIFHSRCASASHWLAILYAKEDERVRNIPKALAALDLALKINSGFWKRRELALQKKLRRSATKKELAEAKQLIADEWPHGEKHRREAFKKLQEVGDIDSSESFDPKQRHQHGNRGL